MNKYYQRLLKLVAVIIITDLLMYSPSFSNIISNHELTQKNKIEQNKIATTNKKMISYSDRMQPLNADLGWSSYAKSQD